MNLFWENWLETHFLVCLGFCFFFVVGAGSVGPLILSCHTLCSIWSANPTRCIPDFVLLMLDFAKAATVMVERVRIMKAFGLGKGKMKRPVQNCRAREAGVFPHISR